MGRVLHRVTLFVAQTRGAADECNAALESQCQRGIEYDRAAEVDEHVARCIGIERCRKVHIARQRAEDAIEWLIRQSRTGSDESAR